MSRWYLSFVCVLALALPLQGWTATAMMPCHGMPVSAPGLCEAPCHEVVDVLASDMEGMGGVGEMGDTAQAHTGCIGCAACHGVAALPQWLPAPSPGSPAGQKLRCTPVSPPIFFTDGPERPPRTDLA